MNLREHFGFQGNYSEIIREERNLAAVFYHILLINSNTQKFLDLIGYNKIPTKGEFGIYYEYAYLRDIWDSLKDKSTEEANSLKRNFIIEQLGLTNSPKLLNYSEREFNEFFGAVPQVSNKYIQSPSNWSIKRFHENIQDDNEFTRVCKFKWSFNAKPDIVIHTSKNEAVCIEAKLESTEGSYPSSNKEKDIFNKKLDKNNYIKQTEVQKYLMEELLGLDTKMIFLTQKVNQKSNDADTITWTEVFDEFNLQGIPEFMETIIDRLK